MTIQHMTIQHMTIQQRASDRFGPRVKAALTEHPQHPMKEIMKRLEDKVVIVTGAGTGIGAGNAYCFLQEGASVVLNGRREQKLHETITGCDAAKSLVRTA